MRRADGDDRQRSDPHARQKCRPGSTISSICPFAWSSRSPRCSRSSSRMRWRGSWPGCSTRSMRGIARSGSKTWLRPSAIVIPTHERDQIVRGVYRHFCMMLMEILHTPRKIHLDNWRDRVVLVGLEPIMDQLMTGNRPLIILTGHYGNWELAGYLFGMFGFPTVSVARTLDNPYLDRYLRSFRERTGQSLIPKTGGFDQMVEVLESNRVLSFLADQDAGQRGLFVDFFGRPASTHKAIALLAIEHQAPVVVGVARRIGPGFRYEIRCEDVIDPAELTGTADDVRLLTQRYTSRPRTPDPPRPDSVPLAPSPLEASAAGQSEAASHDCLV